MDAFGFGLGAPLNQTEACGKPGQALFNRRMLIGKFTTRQATGEHNSGMPLRVFKGNVLLGRGANPFDA
jgi:hypothetical protein